MGMSQKLPPKVPLDGNLCWELQLKGQIVNGQRNLSDASFLPADRN